MIPAHQTKESEVSELSGQESGPGSEPSPKVREPHS